MAIPTKGYNPGFLTDDELRESFCVRTAEFESLVETLRENIGSSNQHVIVVGPRGSGKTTLLLRIALEIRSDPELSSRLYPIVFAEESYCVNTCGEFWLECLSRLAQQEPRRNGDADLRRTLEDVRRERHDRFLAERCLGTLLDFADQEGKRLVLEVENLNQMFSDMTDPDATGWCLRKTLQTEPRIMMIGSTARAFGDAAGRFEEIDRPDRPLYDLFRILSLDPLDRKESALLCERVSGQSVESGAARRLQILTGGSPRLLAIMARFGAARSFRTLISNLLDLVDEHTAYFKSHLESLPPQERRVYLALVELWRPSTAREVADRARMGTSKCSSQLRRLIGRGMVSDAGGTSHRKHYYVSERLYNIYYLLRRSRGTDSVVRALVEFMDALYTRTELKEMVDEVAQVATADPQKRLIYEAALEQLSGLPVLAWHFFENHPDYVSDDVKKITEEAEELLDRGGERFAHGDLMGALVAVTDLLSRFAAREIPLLKGTIGKALVNKGVILSHLGRHDDGLSAIDDAVDRLGSAKSPDLRSVLATAAVTKAVCLEALGRMHDAIAVYDDVIRSLNTRQSPGIAETMAMARFNRGVILGKLEKYQQELEAYDELKHQLASSEPPSVRDYVAKALVNTTIRLVGLGRNEEAISACDELTRRFGGSTSIELLHSVVKGLTVKSALLAMLDRIHEQRSVCDEALRRLDQCDELASSLASDPRHMNTLSLRLQSHEIRMLSYVKQSDDSAVARDVRAVLGILPRLDAVPPRTIKCLMLGGLALGIDRMAALLRESPSADTLLPLTTALEMETGLQPRVALEVREVAEDIRRDLARLREQQGIG